MMETEEDHERQLCQEVALWGELLYDQHQVEMFLDWESRSDHGQPAASSGPPS